jgi:hypothetical protein
MPIAARDVADVDAVEQACALPMDRAPAFVGVVTTWRGPRTIGRQDLAGDESVEQMADRSEPLVIVEKVLVAPGG